MDTLSVSSALCRAGEAAGNIGARPGAARERSAGTELHLGVRPRLARAPLVTAGSGRTPSPPLRTQARGDHGQPSSGEPAKGSDWEHWVLRMKNSQAQPRARPRRQPALEGTQNNLDWKRPHRSWSPIVNLTVPGPPLNHVPEQHSYMLFS